MAEATAHPATSAAPGADPMAQPRFWNVPNILTLSRLVLAVVVFVLIDLDRFLGALVVFALAALTDALDGYVARRLGQATALGRQLDPLVDKLVISGMFVYLLAVPGSGLAAWMVTVIIARELLIQGLRSHLEARGEAFGAKLAGKLKTTAQCLAVAAILAALALRPGPNWLLGRDVLIWASVALTLYSGLGYLANALPMLSPRGDATS